jgi:hypothetical protein
LLKKFGVVKESTALPLNLSVFRDQQRELIEAGTADTPEHEYQRLVLYLLAEIACSLQGYRPRSRPEGP